jgi:hypothetical protein
VATDWHQFPVISGLLTATDPARHSFALESVADFVRQKWRHKELVIVNTTDEVFPELDNVYEFHCPDADVDPWTFGLAQCNGEWVADWQDDCRYSADYLRRMARLRSKEAPVALMSYQGKCLFDPDYFTVENDGLICKLTFRLALEVGQPVWLDMTELVTRYYAAKNNQD